MRIDDVLAAYAIVTKGFEPLIVPEKECTSDEFEVRSSVAFRLLDR